jgi:5'-AMP-activated protein kinase catalytic alpha subunit
MRGRGGFPIRPLLRINDGRTGSEVKEKIGRNIPRRDIKPENTLLDRHLSVKLCAFRFARFQKPDRQMMTRPRSLLYSAPQVVDSKQYNRKAADIWSMGVALYAMRTCTLPSAGGNLADVVNQMRMADIEDPQCMSSRPNTMLTRMLYPNPENRPTIDGVMNADWST